MTYIVLDMEWNQPFDIKHMIKKPVTLIGEIVQIGAVKLNESYQIVDTFKILVTPKYYTKMHRKVSKLTHIYTDDLQYGFPFEQAINHFKRWCGETFSFITWGWDDIGILKDNLLLYGIDDSWLPAAYNLQPIYNNQISKEERQVSLTEAMKKLNLIAADAHDALNDARNTAQICLHLNMPLGFEMYDTFKKPLRRSDDETIRNNYEKRIDAIRDPELSHFICKECGENVTCGEWVKQNGDKYVAIAKCSCGENFFIRMRFRKNNDGTFRAGIVVYLMNNEYRAYYQELIERQAEKEEIARQHQFSLQ